MRELYRLVYNGQDFDRCGEFLEPDYREHNLVLEDGIAASIEHQKQLGGYPNVIYREIRDGDLHCLHVRYFYEPYDYATIDIWRVNAAGKAVEHWDSLAAMSGPQPERMVDGPQCNPAPLAPEERAARIATLREYFDVAVRRKDQRALDRLLAPDFIEHNVGNGWFPGVRQGMDSDITLDTVRVLGAGGDMAFAWTDYRHGGRTKHVAEIFRFDASGRIAEHWDTANHQPRDTGLPRARAVPPELMRPDI